MQHACRCMSVLLYCVFGSANVEISSFSEHAHCSSCQRPSERLLFLLYLFCVSFFFISNFILLFIAITFIYYSIPTELKFVSLVDWDYKIPQLHLCRWVKPLQTSFLDVTLNNIMVWLQ